MGPFGSMCSDNDEVRLPPTPPHTEVDYFFAVIPFLYGQCLRFPRTSRIVHSSTVFGSSKVGLGYWALLAHAQKENKSLPSHFHHSGLSFLFFVFIVLAHLS